MTYENVLNVKLSDLLRERGLASFPEKQRGKKRHDIEVKLGALVAVIEAEKGQHPAAQKSAINEAAGRIKDGTAHIALALCYPDDATPQNLESGQFEWAVISPRTLADTIKWESGGLEDLAITVLQLPNEFGETDTLAGQLSGALDRAVSLLSDESKNALALSLDLPTTGKGGINAAAMRALLVVSTAVMFHSRLGAYFNNGIKPEVDRRENPPKPFRGEWPPPSVYDCIEDPEKSAHRLIKAWHTILALDYRPIFETARDALKSAPQGPGFSLAIHGLADKSLEITSHAVSLRHDLLGRIFHYILDSAKFDGSFYTSTAAATMLASLALPEKTADWKSAESIAKLKIIDPACGTGTLLMATAERIRDLANRAGGVDELESMLIEKVLHGYDTNLTAIHLAATTLGLLSPGTKFSKMNIERTFLGVDEETGQASLGSLEFIPGGQPSLLGWAGGKRHVDDDARNGEIPYFDLVIMNPPFTRDSLRHDQFSREDELELKKREKELFAHYLGRNGNGNEKTLHMSSQGNNFVVLADRLINKKSGTLAAVLPMVTATNPSSLGIRKFIADKFHIETIVVPHDPKPKHAAFSENTGIAELLLVCRRKKRGQKETRVIALTVNPKTPAGALMVAKTINDNGERDTLVEHKISADKMAGGDWTAVQFLSPRLLSFFESLRGGGLFAVTPLKAVGDTLTGQAVRGVFGVKTHAASHGMIALWEHKTDLITKMLMSHDSYIDYKRADKKQAENLWERRAKLLLPTRLNLPGTRSLSVILPRPALGSAWSPFIFTEKLSAAQREKREKVLCLYLNSSAGILALLGIRDFRILGYPRFSKDSLGQLPVPDFAKLSAQKITALAAAFDKLSKKELSPLKSMRLCETRRAIDAAVADALEIEIAVLDEIRELLPREPSISGKRYENLTLK